MTADPAVRLLLYFLENVLFRVSRTSAFFNLPKNFLHPLNTGNSNDFFDLYHA